MPLLLNSHQSDLIHKAFAFNALKFGSFTLKSGRTSPYFFNAGLLSTGPILATLASAYASTIIAAFCTPSPNPLPNFDVLFGPAYKGIPFAACTALVLHAFHNIPVGFAYDRKEVKDHGEGGAMVGVPVNGKRVVVLDDVMTAGTAVRHAIDMVQREGGQVVGVVQCLDREELGQDGVNSSVSEIERIVGVGNVKSILKMGDLILWLETQDGMDMHLKDMRDYRSKYGITAET